MPWQPRKKVTKWRRVPHDYYVEPRDCTDALLSVEPLLGESWDPAAGRGHVVTALRAAGRAAYGTDVVRRVDAETAWFAGEWDFLEHPPRFPRIDNIVCNPPFGRGKTAEAFIRRALTIATRQVCAFVDARFLGSAGRAEGLFADHPCSRVWWLYPRPSCPPGALLDGGGKAGGGTGEFVWIVWDVGDPAPAGRLGRLRRTGLPDRPVALADDPLDPGPDAAEPAEADDELEEAA